MKINVLIISGVLSFTFVVTLYTYFRPDSYDSFKEKQHNEWIEFRKKHDCKLKEIDSTYYRNKKYSWLCDDDITYKNNFNE